MPIYEYQCGGCSRISSFLVRNVGQHRTPACPRCGAQGMARVLSSFSALSGAEKASSGGEAGDFSGAGEDLEGMPDLSALEGVDEQNPRSIGQALRKMARETGEPMDPQMDEICRRLESGEDPEKIEQTLEEADGGPAGDAGGDDTLYDG